MRSQCISSTPAPNQASHTEKAIAVHDASILLWSTEKTSSSIIAHFLELADECLGSGDMDYAERAVLAQTITSSTPVTPVTLERQKAPVATPESGSLSRQKNNGGRGNSGARGGKISKSATPSKAVAKSKKSRASISKRRKMVMDDDYDSDCGSDFLN